MTGNKSVLLTYTNVKRVKFKEYAEFFRLAGIYIYEDWINEGKHLNIKDKGIKFDKQYDMDECVSLDKSLENFNDDDIKLLGDDPDYVNELIKIFKEYDLFRAATILQYFNMDKPFVEKAGDLFNQAAKQLEDYYKQNYSNGIKDTFAAYSLRYAKLYCKQKANLSRFLTKKLLDYSVEDILTEGLKLAKDFPDCSNTWVLIGMICEISKEHKLDAIEAFKKVVDAEWGKPYVAGILYKIANNCEDLETLTRLKNDCYEAAYKTMPEYRNIYRVGLQCMNMEVWDRAVSYFLECIARIELRKSYIDPLEQEYYFKAKGHLAFIYTKNRMYLKAIECAEDALNFKNAIYESMDNPEGVNKMYYEIYMHDKERKSKEIPDNIWDIKELISAELGRMSSKILYQRLATSYQNLGLEDIAEQYWSAIRM